MVENILGGNVQGLSSLCVRLSLLVMDITRNDGGYTAAKVSTKTKASNETFREAVLFHK